MLRAVIFDMDGVLVDTEPLADLFFSGILKEQFSVEVDISFFQKTRGNTSEKFWETVIQEFNLKNNTRRNDQTCPP